MNRKVVMILTLLGTLVLMLLIIVRVAQYLHIRSFKTAATDLVETGTGGRYMLQIGHTEVDYMNFSLTIEDLVVKKKDSTDIHGIMEVHVPGLIIDLGSITRVFTSNQFKIDRLAIREPVATIGIQDKSESDEASQPDPLNVPHQVARFYPVVKTILEHFDIAMFEIDRAALKLEKTHDTFQVRLLDLLVSDWNMQHLADEASFHLSLGNQSVKLQNAAFSFGAVLWDYHKHELDILDYNYIQRDSIGQEVIKVEGSSLKVIKLDYEKLIADEHYYLDRLLVIDPKVTAFIHPGSPKPDRSEHPLADLLKSHFGTMMIRDAEILNAQIDATIYQEQDTLFIHLPGMNLITGNFHVDEDSSTIMIDQLNLDIHRTELDINHQMALSFENLIYDQDYNVKVDSIRIFNKRLSQTLLFSQEMDLYNFSVFHYFFENELKMDSVFLRDAAINITKDTFTKSQHKHRAGKPTPTINIGRLHVENVNTSLKLEQAEGSITVQRAAIDAITFDREIDYAIELVQIPSIRVSKDQNLALSFQNMLVESKRMSIDNIDGLYRGLEIAGNKVIIVSEENISHQSMPGNLQLVEIGQLSLNGSLPTGNKPKKTNTGLQSAIEKLTIGSLNAGITIGDSCAINVDLSNINVVDVALHPDKQWSYEYLQTQIKSGQYQKGPITYTLGNSSINTNAQSRLSGVEITKKDEFRARTASVELGPIDYTSDSLGIDHLTIKQIGFTDISAGATSKIDSIKLRDILLRSELPFSQQVFIYGPDLNVANTESKGNNAKKGNEIPLPSQFFNELTVFPGSVSFGDQRLDFGQLALQAEQEMLMMDLKNLSLETNSNTIEIGRVWSGPSDLYLDSIKQVPKPEFIQQIDTELDVISAQVNRARLHNINWAALWEHKRFESDSLTIDGIDAEITRDKTLPDPEHQWKPYLLAQFIPEVDNINIPRISGTNGRVVYREKGEKTGKEGFIAIDDISFQFNRYHPLSEPEQVSHGQGRIYGQGHMSYHYHRLDSGRFSFGVNLSDMPLLPLNQMVDPLEAARFKSGHLHEFQLELVGDSLQATGVGTITYDDVHVEIFKSHQPDVKNFGSELLTLLVDKIILKHSKYQASADFTQDRITFKGPINYWIKSGIHGASAAVMKGKSLQEPKKKSRE
jgi:hypothetical protein